jgi:class 3 adenylate cyclase/pimeloyl-ACP methyl ester carboxylesterase
LDIRVRELPPIRYTKIGDDVVAYRDCGGEGPALLYLGTSGSHQDLIWEEPGYAHFLRSLASLGRLVTLDRRGSGLSTHVIRPTIESRVADIAAVADVLEIDEAVIVAASGSTQGALAFAATHPDRCRALVLYAPSAKLNQSPDYEVGTPRAAVDLAFQSVEEVWGTGITAWLYAPTLANDAQFVAWAARCERATATPVEAREWLRMYDETDVRNVLPLVRVPALVASPAHAETHVMSQFVAEHISTARFVEIASRDQWPFGDGMQPFLTAISDFLPSVVEINAAESAARRLATVLFTDMVASTEQLREAGDRQWRALLESHDDIAERTVARHGGRIVKSTGDGMLALFDGPASAAFTALELVRTLERVGIHIRAGVHTGEVETHGEDVAGIAVHLCSRVADLAAADEVLTTTTVRDLTAGSGLRFVPRGEHELKGIPDPVEILAVSSPPP